MDIGKVLSRTFDIYIKNFVVLFVSMLLASIIGSITFGILMGPMMIGMLRICRKVLRGEKAEIGEVFNGFDLFGPSFVLFLLTAIAVGVAAAVISLLNLIFVWIPILGWIVIFLLWVAFGLAVLMAMGCVLYALMTMIDRGLGVNDAIKAAFAWIKEKTVEKGLCFLVLGIISSIISILTASISPLGLVVMYDEGSSVPANTGVTV